MNAHQQKADSPSTTINRSSNSGMVMIENRKRPTLESPYQPDHFEKGIPAFPEQKQQHQINDNGSKTKRSKCKTHDASSFDFGFGHGTKDYYNAVGVRDEMNASTSPPLWHGNDTTDEMARGLRSLLKEEKEESTPSPPQFIRSAAQVMLHSSGASPPTLHLLPTASSLLSDPILTGETKAKDTTRKSTTATATPHLDESLLPTLNTTDVASPNRYSLATNPSKGQSTRDTPFSADLLEQAKAAMEAMNVPSSLMVGKLISTEYGIAMLVVPNSNVSTTQFSALTSPSTTTTLVDTKCKHWSKTEDELLKYAIDKEDSVPFNWKEISRTYFPRTRTSTQCKNRWKKLNPSICYQPFTAAEDKIILAGAKDGLSWPSICAKLPGRTSEIVRSRFVNSIDPSLFKHVAWTAKEEHILQTEQRRLGNKWTQIAKFLPGRSENDVKNHWHNAKIKTNRMIKTLAADKCRLETLASLRSSAVSFQESSLSASSSVSSLISEDVMEF